ncbi:hypothetical protein [Rubrolithibacter danxiaensis]|uniref:hypothetical protein n=1 Tax=Rubrolithibacter danxiaensis TaxID=3390805 RepID=UPI003BF8A481
MEIKVKDPKIDELLKLEANPSENDTEPGWSVKMPAGDSIFITLQDGKWEVRHNDTVDPDFVRAIGEAISPSSDNKEQTWEDRKNPENVSDERDAEKLLLQKKEADIRKRNLTGNSGPEP